MPAEKKIVVIDDCRLTLAMARDLLEEAGFRVETAETGIDANRFIYEPPRPDLILIDLVMPMLHGDRKVRLLKQREASRDIPVILMSNRPACELEELARASGANGFLSKPLEKQSLLGEIRRLL